MTTYEDRTTQVATSLVNIQNEVDNIMRLFGEQVEGDVNHPLANRMWELQVLIKEHALYMGAHWKSIQPKGGK